MERTCSKNLTCSSLKIIAMSTMLVDHIAASVMERYMNSAGLFPDYSDLNSRINAITIVYLIMRLIGRLSFPIYIFLLIEGFLHTSSRLKYLLRLSVFALVSEIPFDMAFQLDAAAVKSGTIFELTYQNVFFTLAIGLLTIMLIDLMKRYVLETIPAFLYAALITVFGMIAAYLLRSDYSYEGVFAIVATYAARTAFTSKQEKDALSKKENASSEEKVEVENKANELSVFEKKKIVSSMYGCALVLTMFNLMEVISFFDILFIKRYNGKRGMNVKLLFYAFYPVHLLILGLICVLVNV